MQEYIKTLEILEAMTNTPEWKVEVKKDYTVNPDGQVSDFESNDFIGQSLNQAKIYEIDGRIGRIFLLTSDPIRPGIHLPFPAIFLNLRVEYDDVIYHGFLAMEIKRIGKDLNDYELLRERIDGIGNDDIHDIVVFSLYERKTKVGDTTQMGIFKFTLFHESPLQSFESLDAKMMEDGKKLLGRVVMNFIDFVHYPEVTIRTRHRSEKGNLRRKREGKPTLPSSNILLVTGQMKVYVDSVRPLEGGDLDNSWEVAGHWRTLRSDRYKEQGKRVWVRAHMRGHGTTIKKRRKIPITHVKYREHVSPDMVEEAKKVHKEKEEVMG